MIEVNIEDYTEEWLRQIDTKDTSKMQKSWIPYEGPKGGEGWQNADNPDDIRYQDEPPGEIEDGYEEMAEGWGEDSTEQFINAIKDEYGHWASGMAQRFNEDNPLLDEFDPGYVKLAAKVEFGENYDEFSDFYEEFRENTNLDSLADPRKVTMDVIRGIQETVDSERDYNKAYHALGERYEIMQWGDDVPEVPFGRLDETAWKRPVPEAEENFQFGTLNEQDGVLFERDGVLTAGRLFQYEGPQDGTTLYTLQDGTMLTRDEMLAYAPNENQALPLGDNWMRASEGQFVRFEIGATPYEGEVTNIEVLEGNKIGALLSTPNGIFRVNIDPDADNPTLETSEGDEVYLRERFRHPPDDFQGVAEGMKRDPWLLASDITDNLGENWHRSPSIEQDIRNELEKYFPKSAVSEFYDAVHDWKGDAQSGKTGIHAKAFKRALDIHSHARGWSDVKEANVQVAETMYHVSQSFLKKQYGDSITLHRGMSNTGFRELAQTWLMNPNAEEYELSQMALNNYSTQYHTAQDFAHDTARVSTTLDTKKVAFAMDDLAAKRMDNEGEVHVIGDGITADRDNIGFSDNGMELSEFPDGWVAESHVDFADRFKDHYALQMPLPKESHEAIFQAWADEIRESHPDLLQRGEDGEENDVAELVKTIERDAFLIYEVEQGPQTQLDDFKAKDSTMPTIDLTDEQSVRWNAFNHEGTPDEVKETHWNQYTNWQDNLVEERKKSLEKEWIPYEGPRGGEGWQNTEDPDDVRYGLDEPPGEVAEGYSRDHWDKYPSGDEWPDSPFGTEWYKPQAYGPDAGMQEGDALAFINYDDEIVAGEIAEFLESDRAYKMENGYYVQHSQVVGHSEPRDDERLETSVGMVTEGDWLTYDNDFGMELTGKVTDIESNEGHDVVTVVGETGYDEIEITGQSGKRSEYNAEIRRIHDRPDLWENVEQNGMTMDTDEIVSDIYERVDMSDIESNRPARRQLTRDQRHSIRTELERFFPEQYVDTYYGSVESWKLSPTIGTAREHEAAFRKALDIESPTHDVAVNGNDQPTANESHVKIAEVMAEISDKHWREHFGGRHKIHRGISNTSFSELFPQWLENPNATKYNVEQLALNNYSVSRRTANEFGDQTAVVSIEADTDDVVLCTDFVSNIGTIQDEAEIQIHGDDQHVDARDIHLLGADGPSLGEHPQDWDYDEHKAFGGFLSNWYLHQSNGVADEEAPLTETQYQTLLEWTNAVRSQHSRVMDNFGPIEIIVREIENDVQAYHGLEPESHTGLGKADTNEYPTIDLTNEEDANWLSEAGEKPQRERLSESLFEELVEANRRKREDIDTETDDPRRESTRLKGRIEIGKLNQPDVNPISERTLQKAGDNFYKVDDMLLDAWEKQVCADSLDKAPNMWRRGESVPQFVRTFVLQAATNRKTMWDEYNDVPHMAALTVHEIIKDNLTNPDGWSIETIVDDLTDEFEGVSEKQAETIARTEVAAVLNDARAMAYDESGEDLQFYWSGPNDEHTTELCTEVKAEVENLGGYVEKDELKEILRRKARKYKDEGGTPERVDSWIAHFNERHTLVRSEFRWL